MSRQNFIMKGTTEVWLFLKGFRCVCVHVRVYVCATVQFLMTTLIVTHWIHVRGRRPGNLLLSLVYVPTCCDDKHANMNTRARAHKRALN